MKKTFFTFFLFLTVFLIVIDISMANPLKNLFEEGISSYGQKDYKEAIKKFEILLNIYDEFAPAYYFLALSYKDMGGEVDQIKYLLKRAIEINPEYSDAYSELSKVYFGLGEFDKSVETSLKALEIDPNLLSIRLSLAWTYVLSLEDSYNAIIHFQKVLQSQEIPYALFGLGLSYFHSDQRMEVIDMITKLRGVGEDIMAEHLEKMLRDNEFKVPESLYNSFVSAKERKHKNISFVTDLQMMSGGNMDVRLLSAKSPKRKVINGLY